LFAFIVVVFVFKFIVSNEEQLGLEGAVQFLISYNEQMSGQRCGVEKIEFYIFYKVLMQ